MINEESPTTPPPSRTSRRRRRLGPVRSAAALAALAAALLTGLQPPSSAAGAAPSPAPAGAVPAALSPQEHADLLAEAARAAVQTATTLRLDPQESLLASDAVKDTDGTVHFRYDRTFSGLPVLGGDLVVHRSPQGALTATRARPGPVAVPSITPAVPADQVTGSLQSPTRTSAAPRLVVWAAAGRPALAWESVVEGTENDGTPSEEHVVTDAASGARLYTYEAVRTGSAQGQYNGTVTIGTRKSLFSYEMTDTTRGNQRTYNLRHGTTGQGSLLTDADDKWGNGSQSSDQTAGVDAHYGAGKTWDYLQQVHGRAGIRGDGVAPYSRVHYGNNYKNAYWLNSCFCMTYGDGENNAKPLTELDVAGHEMAHGLTAATAGLQYARESGGLNEATSDIFGTAVAFHADNAADRPGYLMGRLLDYWGDGTPLRRMDRPSSDGHSPDYWYDGIAGIDVHYSSGPANHFHYLLAEGSGAKTINGIAYDSPTVDGKPVPGIGRANAERIWYRALTTYMTSTTDYSGARKATLQAAADLFGPNSTTVAVVAATWSAVNVRA